MAEAEIVEDVEASYLSAMQRKLDTWGKFKETKNFTIFRAPRGIDQTKKNLLEPSVISIGPFHHGETRFQAMEEKKWQFLRDFLSRGDHITLNFCMSKMKQLEERTRRCYSERVDLDSNAFVEMMLLDGCFVLEYFLKESHGWLNSCFEFGWNYWSVLTDLRLLENQIPFFVVEKLCEIGVREERINFVNDLICIMARGPTEHQQIVNPPTEIHHLVQYLYHHCSVPNYLIEPVVLRSKLFHLTRTLSPNRIRDLLPGFLSWMLPRRFSGSTSQSSSLASHMLVIPCASELQDAGIKFRPKRNPQHMLDISFVHGVLEIPTQFISCSTKPLLTNLVAFEQNKVGQMNAHLTSFLLFLNYLVNTQKDVMILQQCGIIQNILSSEEELTNFLNQVGDGLLYDPSHFLAKLFMEVNIYYESSWNKHRAKLVHDYFSSPWAAISLIAALVLLGFTFVQTFFAVYAYFVPPSS